MRWVKTTEGEGYIGGDYECWCINPVPFDKMNELCMKALQGDETDFGAYLDIYDGKRVYPNDFVPDELEEHNEPLVKYKVTFEVMIVEREES